jgi:hypothetical protein
MIEVFYKSWYYRRPELMDLTLIGWSTDMAIQ